MKLQNKKTGEIGYLYANKNENYNVLDADDKVLAVYPSLAELNEEWEDYEEPKEYWYISGSGCVVDTDDGFDVDKKRKEIGNYFETEEEAEKAVEKLKAWTRLKNGGFKFKGYYLGLGGNFSIKFETGAKCNTKDLDLLFSGEDENEV
jgi:hypothetical protein